MRTIRQQNVDLRRGSDLRIRLPIKPIIVVITILVAVICLIGFSSVPFTEDFGPVLITAIISIVVFFLGFAGVAFDGKSSRLVKVNVGLRFRYSTGHTSDLYATAFPSRIGQLALLCVLGFVGGVTTYFSMSAVVHILSPGWIGDPTLYLLILWPSIVVGFVAVPSMSMMRIFGKLGLVWAPEVTLNEQGEGTALASRTIVRTVQLSSLWQYLAAFIVTAVIMVGLGVGEVLLELSSGIYSALFAANVLVAFVVTLVIGNRLKWPVKLAEDPVKPYLFPVLGSAVCSGACIVAAGLARQEPVLWIAVIIFAIGGPGILIVGSFVGFFPKTRHIQRTHWVVAGVATMILVVVAGFTTGVIFLMREPVMWSSPATWLAIVFFCIAGLNWFVGLCDAVITNLRDAANRDSWPQVHGFPFTGRSKGSSTPDEETMPPAVSIERSPNSPHLEIPAIPAVRKESPAGIILPNLIALVMWSGWVISMSMLGSSLWWLTGCIVLFLIAAAFSLECVTSLDKLTAYFRRFPEWAWWVTPFATLAVGGLAVPHGIRAFFTPGAHSWSWPWDLIPIGVCVVAIVVWVTVLFTILIAIDRAKRQIGVPLTCGHSGEMRHLAVGKLDGRDMIAGLSWFVQTWEASGKPAAKIEVGLCCSLAIGSLNHQDVIVSGGYRKSVKAWDTKGKPIFKQEDGAFGIVYSVAVGTLNDHQDVIVSGGYDDCVHIWDANGRPKYQPLVGHTGDVNCVAIGTLDGRGVVVSGSDDKTIRVWWFENGQPIGNVVGLHAGMVNCVAIGTLNGREVVVSGSCDKTIGVWWYEDGQPVSRMFRGHTGLVNSVAVGAIDGSDVIVSGSTDGTVRIWDSNGQPIGEPIKFATPVTSVAIINGRPVAVAKKAFILPSPMELAKENTGGGEKAWWRS